jgi:hypothetical protein
MACQDTRTNVARIGQRPGISRNQDQRRQGPTAAYLPCQPKTIDCPRHDNVRDNGLKGVSFEPIERGGCVGGFLDYEAAIKEIRSGDGRVSPLSSALIE